MRQWGRFFGQHETVYEELPQFRVTTTVSLEGHGGFKVTVFIEQLNEVFGTYSVIKRFEEQCAQQGINTAKEDLNHKADRFIEKLKTIPQEEVRYVN